MKDLDLKGRRPDELPDKETCDEILLDLKDTGLFDIRWIDLKSFSYLDSQFSECYTNWRADNKAFDNFVERGQVVMYEVDESELPNRLTEEFAESTIKIKEKRYDIIRHPIRLNVEHKPTGDYRSYNTKEKSEEINLLSNDCYQRLKDYIGQDVIQDQFLYTNFQIDFILSSCKVIK